MRIVFVVAAAWALAYASPAEAQLAPGFGFQQGRATPAQVLQLRADAASLLEAERKFNWLWKDSQGKALNQERWKEITALAAPPGAWC